MRKVTTFLINIIVVDRGRSAEAFIFCRHVLPGMSPGIFVDGRARGLYARADETLCQGQ
jgi:hypothetical protein